MTNDAPSEPFDHHGFVQHEAKFFEELGRCIADYQTNEDYLEYVFAAGLRGKPGQAAALFATARGLEGKLKIVAAALADMDDKTRARWRDLSDRMQQSAEDRNDMAHGEPTHASAGVEVPGKLPGSKRVGSGGIELWKRTKTWQRIWTVTDMQS